MPALYHDNHAVRPADHDRGGARPERRPGDQAIVPGRPRGPSTRSGRSSSTSHGRVSLPPSRAGREWIDRYRGHFARAGTVAPGDLRSPVGLRLCPEHRAGPAAAVGAGLGRPARPRHERALAAVHGVFRGLPVLHRSANRPGARFHRGRGATPSTPRSSSSRTTVPAPKVARKGPSTKVGSRTSREPAPTRCTTASTTSVARTSTTTTHGAGRWQGTPRSSAWKHKVHRGRRGHRASSACRPADQRQQEGGIRRQYAHTVDIAPTVLELAGTHLRRDRRHHADPPRRDEFRLHARRRRG